MIVQYDFLYSLYCTLDLYGLFTTCYKYVPLISSVLPPLPICGNHHFALVFTHLTFLGSTFKWHYPVLVFLCLTHLSVICSRSITVSQMGRHIPFSWLNNIPQSICITSFLSIHLLKCISFVFISWLLWIKLPSTWKCIYLIESNFQLLWVYTQNWNCWIVWEIYV